MGEPGVCVRAGVLWAGGIAFCEHGIGRWVWVDFANLRFERGGDVGAVGGGYGDVDFGVAATNEGLVGVYGGRDVVEWERTRSS